MNIDVREHYAGNSFVIFIDNKLIGSIFVNGKRNGFFTHSQRNKLYQKELDLVIKYLNLIRDYYIIHNNKIHATISSIVNINPKDKEVFIKKQINYIKKELLKTARELNKNKIIFGLNSIIHETNNCMKRYIKFLFETIYNKAYGNK